MLRFNSFKSTSCRTLHKDCCRHLSYCRSALVFNSIHPRRIPSQQTKQQLLQSFGTQQQRRKRYHYAKHKNSINEYWDKEYNKSKIELERMTKKVSLNEPKQLNDIISWKVLVFMSISPVLICFLVPDLRQSMFDSLRINVSYNDDNVNSDGDRSNNENNANNNRKS
jgi:hypothetical protein